MSAPTLAEAVAQYGRDANLLTIAYDGPHASFMSVDLTGSVIACAIGKSAARNTASKPTCRCSGRQGSRAVMLSSSTAQLPNGASRAA